MSDSKLTDEGVTAIDKAIAAAQARKAQKAAGETPGPSMSTFQPGSTPARTKVTEEEKAARLAKREQERTERKAARDAERAQKKAAAAELQPAHMRKVQKAAERLSPLGQAAQLLFNEAQAALTAAELTTLALHIQHFNRVQATQRALGSEVSPGTKVEIVSGDPRYIGKVGTVVKAQRIRCYVNIAGSNNRPVPGTDAEGIYFFTSDVLPVAVEAESEVEEASPEQEAAPEAISA